MDCGSGPRHADAFLKCKGPKPKPKKTGKVHMYSLFGYTLCGREVSESMRIDSVESRITCANCKRCI